MEKPGRILLDEVVAREVKKLDLASLPGGGMYKLWLHIINNSLGEPVRIPIMVAKGKVDGPVLGLTAAVHGNELNGIPVIQRIFEDIDIHSLKGTVVGALVINVPGLLLEQRRFNDGDDLNRIAPGKPRGNNSQVYINRVIDRIMRQFEYHIDLHTASFGRINSYYIRADMDNPVTARMARLQNPRIILHNPPNDTTLRGAAEALGINTITVELQDPHIFQPDVIRENLVGIQNVMADLGMISEDIQGVEDNTILCRSSFWIYTDEGGILRVHPQVTQTVSEGDKIATVRTIFGRMTKEYFAPSDGIVIGKSVNPLNQTGARILHLGVDTSELPFI